MILISQMSDDSCRGMETRLTCCLAAVLCPPGSPEVSLEVTARSKYCKSDFSDITTTFLVS